MHLKRRESTELSFLSGAFIWWMSMNMGRETVTARRYLSRPCLYLGFRLVVGGRTVQRKEVVNTVFPVIHRVISKPPLGTHWEEYPVFSIRIPSTTITIRLCVSICSVNHK